MAYAQLTTVEMVQVYFKGVVFSSSTTPTDGQVSEFIDRATAIIYGALQDKYVIPITNAADLLQLRELAEIYVLGKVRLILGKTTPRVLRDGTTMQMVDDLTEFYKRLEKYTSSEIVLTNSANSSSILKTHSYTSENSIEPIAKLGVDQW